MFDSVALKVLHQVVANLVILLGAQVMNLFELRYLLVTRRDNYLSDLSRDVPIAKCLCLRESVLMEDVLLRLNS